jgi:hypothetical protein
MNLRHLQPGDLVEANVRGVLFTAEVHSVDVDGLRAWVEPTNPNYSFRSLRRSQVLRVISHTDIESSGVLSPSRAVALGAGSSDGAEFDVLPGSKRGLPCHGATSGQGLDLDAGRLFPIHTAAA